MPARSLSPSVTSAALGTRLASAKCPLRRSLLPSMRWWTWAARRSGSSGPPRGLRQPCWSLSVIRWSALWWPLAPTSVAWANVGPGLDGSDRPLRSSWTWRREPLAFVPYDPDRDPAAFRGLYEASLERFAEAARQAAIPIHTRPERLVLVAGGDDQVWPSDLMASELASRRDRTLHTDVIIHPEAGHRVILPGEAAAEGGMAMVRGGTIASDTELGEQSWSAVLDALALEGPPVRSSNGSGGH